MAFRDNTGDVTYKSGNTIDINSKQPTPIVYPTQHPENFAGNTPVMISKDTTLTAVIDATFATDSSIQPLMKGKTDLSAATGTVTYDCSNGQRVFSHFGVNASANWIADFTNLPMSNNEAHYITVISSNGSSNANTYFINGIKIDGVNAIWTASWNSGAKNTYYIYKFVIVNTVSGPVVYGDRVTTIPQ